MVKAMCVVKGQGRIWPWKFKGQGHGQGQIWWSHLRPWVQSICLLSVSWHLGHFWQIPYSTLNIQGHIANFIFSTASFTSEFWYVKQRSLRVCERVRQKDSQFIMIDNWEIFTTWNVHNDGDLMITHYLCMDWMTCISLKIKKLNFVYSRDAVSKVNDTGDFSGKSFENIWSSL